MDSERGKPESLSPEEGPECPTLLSEWLEAEVCMCTGEEACGTMMRRGPPEVPLKELFFGNRTRSEDETVESESEPESSEMYRCCSDASLSRTARAANEMSASPMHTCMLLRLASRSEVAVMLLPDIRPNWAVRPAAPARSNTKTQSTPRVHTTQIDALVCVVQDSSKRDSVAARRVNPGTFFPLIIPREKVTSNGEGAGSCERDEDTVAAAVTGVSEA